MSVGVRRARSRTGSVSGEPSFARGLAEEMLAFSPCYPPASRTESTSGVPARGRISDAFCRRIRLFLETNWGS